MPNNTSTTAVKATAKTTVIPNTPVRFLWYVSKPHTKWMVLATIFAATAAAISQGSAIFFKWIVDAVEAGDYERVLFIGLLYPAAIFAIQLTYRASGFMGMFWVVNTKKQTYDQLVDYSLGHSHGYYINRFAGSILSKVSNVVNAMESFITSYLWTFLDAFISFSVTFIFILFVDVVTSLVFLGLLLVLILFNWQRMPKKRELSKYGAETATVLRGNIVDLFTNASAVRQYGRRASELSLLDGLTKENRNAQKANWCYSEMTMVYNSFILFLFSSFMFYLLLNRWQAEAISTGEFAFVLALMFQLTGLLIYIGRIMSELARVVGEAEEGLEDLITPYEIMDGAAALPLKSKGG